MSHNDEQTLALFGISGKMYMGNAQNLDCIGTIKVCNE